MQTGAGELELDQKQRGVRKKKKKRSQTATNSPSSFILYKFHNHGICIDIVDFFFPVFKTDIKDSHKNSLY